jgi:hypothetical protein
MPLEPAQSTPNIIAAHMGATALFPLYGVVLWNKVVPIPKTLSVSWDIQFEDILSVDMFVSYETENRRLPPIYLV